MQLTELWEVFLVASLGGVVAEALHWWTLFRKERAAFPRYSKNAWYWLIAVFLCLAAGGVTTLQLGAPAYGWAAAELGLAGPLLLHKIATNAADAHRERRSTLMAYLGA